MTHRRRRSVAYTESEDLLTWPEEPLLILVPDEFDDFGKKTLSRVRKKLSYWKRADTLVFIHTHTHTHTHTHAQGNWTTNFYGMPVIQYEGVFIGMLWIFRATDPDGYWYAYLLPETVSLLIDSRFQ